MLEDKIANFEKVSLERFILDMLPYVEKNYNKRGTEAMDLITEMYRRIKIPARSTTESAGYDFYTYEHVILPQGEGIVIPTGIRCDIKAGFSLDIYPRSGQGFKHHLVIANTIGIIDSDYYHSDNEGHIMIKLVYEGFKNSEQDSMVIKSGTAFAQGILHEVFGALNDKDTEFIKRNGGLGSTTK